jgi:glutathione S-transferase
LNEPLLWHFPISHFNEKVRWALDFKGVPHRRQALAMGYVPRVFWATGQVRLPVLFLDGRAIADSTRIIAALEAKYPEPALYPADAAERRRALALEDFFDEDLGPGLRALIIGEAFATDPEAALRALTTGMGAGPLRAARAILPAFRTFYGWRHKIDATTIAAGRRQVAAALDRIEGELGSSGYLVGERFGIADLTAAALFSPLTRPPEFPYPISVAFPTAIETLRAALAERRGFRWLLEMYRRHRGRSAEMAG